jgi:hypothetical protein
MTVNSTPPALPEMHITQEQLDAIAGGGCTPAEVVTILADLKNSYESLIEFTSYVIERVAGP